MLCSLELGLASDRGFGREGGGRAGGEDVGMADEGDGVVRGIWLCEGWG